MHSNALAIFDKYAMPHLKPGMRVLEVGIGKRYWLSPYRKMAADMKWDFHFCDAGNFGDHEPDFIRQSREYQIDCEPVSFDAVISQQTIEHVRNPFKFMMELASKVKNGGILAVVCPVSWERHRNPIDAWRLLPDGMRAALDAPGVFDAIAIKMESLAGTEAEKACQFHKGGDVYDTIGVWRRK